MTFQFLSAKFPNQRTYESLRIIYQTLKVTPYPPIDTPNFLAGFPFSFQVDRSIHALQHDLSSNPLYLESISGSLCGFYPNLYSST